MVYYVLVKRNQIAEQGAGSTRNLLRSGLYKRKLKAVVLKRNYTVLDRKNFWLCGEAGVVSPHTIWGIGLVVMTQGFHP